MKHIGHIEISLIFAWYDFWVGIYYNKRNRCIYIFPLPMCGIRIRLPAKRKRKNYFENLENSTFFKPLKSD